MMKLGRATTSSVLFEPCAGGGVYLRHPHASDYEQWAQLRLESQQYLQPWEPSWRADHLTQPAYRTRLSAFKKMVANDQGYPFHVFRASDNVLVGACNLTNVQRRVKQSAALGYWVGERFSRQGFARASVRAASKFTFETLGLHRLEAAVQPENSASIRLLETLGFAHEGVARGFLKIDGQWRDHHLFARLSTDDVVSETPPSP